MSSRPIDRSPPLKRLRDEGFDLEIAGGYLAVHDIPYVTRTRNVARGVLLCPLGDAANDIVGPPPDHTALFAGECPCSADGAPLAKIINSDLNTPLSNEIRPGLVARYSFSAKPKPKDNYDDFYAKVTHYVRLLSNPAREIEPDATAQTFPHIRAGEESVFNYVDTASSRADVVQVSRKLALKNVAILGLGGTGGYILDFLAKTHVENIHLFDGDVFLQHNAFRAPGAASGGELEEKLPKVLYFARLYEKMRKGIVPHPYYISEANLHELEGMAFVFICMEAGETKRLVVEMLETRGIPFVDVGMGVYMTKAGSLGGTLRTTANTPAKRDHFRGQVPFSDGGVKNEYDKNIQIAELNALNAAFAVIRWKKLFGFYDDRENEHHSTYVIGRNDINNEDQP